MATLCTALGRIGFTNDAATAITTVQGIDSLEELELLNNHEVENFCKVLCRPRGQAPSVAGGQPQPNLGISVSLKAENNLKLACYQLQYKTRTSRPTAAVDITLASVRLYKDHK